MSTKIIVCYHKKDKLYKDDIFVPVHCGRDVALQPSKDGIINNADKIWLEENLIGDNTGDNISLKNRSLNEMTAVYWVWKNYDKIGNPDYIGLNHYRRFFDISYNKLDNLLNKYDFVKHRHYKSKDSYYTLWMKSFNKDFYNIAEKVFQEVNPEEYDKFNKFMHSKINGGLCNMFILSKEDFFRYCEFIFSILLKLPLDDKYKRNPGMFAERLTSFYLYELEKKKKAKNSSIVVNPYENKMQKFFSIKRHEISKHVIVTILGLKMKFNIKGRV